MTVGFWMLGFDGWVWH